MHRGRHRCRAGRLRRHQPREIACRGLVARPLGSPAIRSLHASIPTVHTPSITAIVAGVAPCSADDRFDVLRHLDVLRVRHAVTDDRRLESDHGLARLHGSLHFVADTDNHRARTVPPDRSSGRPHCASMSVESDEPIRVTHEGSVATVWLNRPDKRNAMTYAMWATLEDVALRLGADPGVRVVVLRGAGSTFLRGCRHHGVARRAFGRRAIILGSRRRRRTGARGPTQADRCVHLR